MKRGKGTLGLAFLDVLSCALGATVILAVIFSLIKDPPSATDPDRFLFAAFQTEGNVELGVEIRTPTGVFAHVFENSPFMDLHDCAGAPQLWTSTDLGSPDRRWLFLRIPEPTKGDWTLRPYAVRWRDKRSAETSLKLKAFRWATLKESRNVMESGEMRKREDVGTAGPAFTFEDTVENTQILASITID